MQRRTRYSIVAGLVAASLCAFTPEAHADERTEARAHFKKGMEAIGNGKYDEGIEELKRAYDILPHPNVLFNIARAYVDEGDLEDAVAYYKKYLEGSPKDKDEVQKIVDSLEARIRRQQARVLESQQQTQPTQGGGVTTLPGIGPGAGPSAGPGAGGPGTSVAPGSGPGGPSGPSAPGTGPTMQGGATVPINPTGDQDLKTQDVFEESVTTASKGAQSPLDAPNSTSIITSQDVRLNGKAEIAELFRGLAGVDLMETTGSQTELSMRGFNQRLSNKVLVLVDGRSVYVDLLGATLWQSLSISADDIDHIEVVRGPGSALYGADAFNGVINIITKAPGEGKNGVDVGYGTSNEAHGSVWATGRDKDFAYRVSGGYDYLPRWSREAPDGRADLKLSSADQNASGRTERFDLRTTYQLGKDWLLGVGGGFTHMDTLEVLGIGVINDEIISGQQSDLTAYLKNKHLEVRAFWNNFNVINESNEATIGQSLLPGRAQLNVVDAEVEYVDQFETGKGINHDLHVGLGYRLKAVSWTYLDQDRTENHESLYAHDEVKLGSKFAVVGDYRVDYVPYLERFVQSPRGSVLFHPSKGSTIRGIVATAFRTPDFLESYISLPVQLPFAGAQSTIQNQPGFKVQPEQVFTTELGYMNQDSDYIAIDTAFFYNHVKNLIELSPNRANTLGDIANGAGGLDPSSGLYSLFSGGFDNQCQTYNLYGAELGVRAFPVEGLDLFANYTLNKVVQDNSQCSPEQLVLIATDSRTSLNKIHAGAQLRTKRGFDFELGFHYYSPEDWAEQEQNIQAQRIEYQTFHLDAYYTMNLTATYRFLQNRATLTFVGLNMLDNEHREHPFGQLVQRKMLGFFGYSF